VNNDYVKRRQFTKEYGKKSYNILKLMGKNLNDLKT